MIHQDGIEVFIKSISRGQAYNEYHGQYSSIAVDTGSMERYIEVHTGEHFAVVVNIHPHFDFEGATSFRISRISDGDKKHTRRYVSFKRIMANKPLGRFSDEWFEMREYTPGGWELVKPAFAQIEFGKVLAAMEIIKYLTGPDESISITGGEVHERMSKLGMIQVTIELGSHKTLGEQARGSLKQTPTVEASKIAAFGYSHTIEVESTGKKATPTYKHEWKPLQKTKSSGPYVFTFRYRSRQSLQQLGIIPTSPEPAPQQLLADSEFESNSVAQDIAEAQNLQRHMSLNAANAADGAGRASRAAVLSNKRDHEQHTELSIADGLATDSGGLGPSKRMKTETGGEKQIIELSDDDKPSRNPRSLVSSKASASTSAVTAEAEDEQDLRDDLRCLEIEREELAIKRKLRDMQKGKGKGKAQTDIKQEYA